MKHPSKTAHSNEDTVAWSLLTALADAVVLVDPGGVIQIANEAAIKRFALTGSDIIGKSIWDFISKPQVNYLRVILNEAVQTGAAITVKYQENDRWNQTVIYPLEQGTSQTSLAAFWIQDITPLVAAQENYKRAALQLITAQEDERHRIARDLHDDIGQKMTALALSLRSIEGALERGQTVSVEDVRRAIRNLESITKQTRQVFYQLHPPSLGAVALPKVLAAFCTSFEDSTGIIVDFNCQDNLPDLSELQIMVVYRFVQEGLANIAKHSMAARAWISIDYHNGDLSISLEDNGKGYEPMDTPDGLGLRGIRERFQVLNGNFEVESASGKGTHIFGTLPVEAKDDTDSRS